MPRIILAKKHPPTSIEIPDREKGSLILLPGISKKVTVDEVSFIKKNFPALSFVELPTKLQRRKKTARTAAPTPSLSASIPSVEEKPDDGKSDDGKKKKRGR